MNIKVNDKLEKIFEKRETKVNHTTIHLMDHRIIELEAKLKEADGIILGLTRKIENNADKFIGPQNPELTYSQTKEAIELFEMEYMGQPHKQLWDWAVSRAYANIPEPPEQGDTE